MSKVATNEVKPNGQIEIPFGTEKSYLAPLSITKIPGIGQKTAQLLIKAGVKTVKTLSEIPVKAVQNLLGKNGIELWRRTNGIDESPVVPYHEQKSISTENTFSEDTMNMNFLHTEIVRMTERIGFELRSHNRLTGCVTLKLRYADFETFTRQKTIAYTNSDAVLIRAVSGLFNKLYQPGMLVRLVGVRLSHLIPRNYQISLFDDTPETIRLYQAIDSVKKRFGEQYLTKASGLGQDCGEHD